MSEAIISFVRNPEKGKVKTRLAASLGEEVALKIYKFLLAHTSKLLDNTAAKKYIFYHEKIPGNDLWQGADFEKKIQVNADLGAKMQDAFQQVFNEGHVKIIIIGSDCYDLSSAIISQAFADLDKNDIVIGPAKDGGFYLLGMKAMHPKIFSLNEYSTDHVYSDTIQICNDMGLSVSSLPVLSDVDEAEDVTFDWE